MIRVGKVSKSLHLLLFYTQNSSTGAKRFPALRTDDLLNLSHKKKIYLQYQVPRNVITTYAAVFLPPPPNIHLRAREIEACGLRLRPREANSFLLNVVPGYTVVIYPGAGGRHLNGGRMFRKVPARKIYLISCTHPGRYLGTKCRCKA